jgi:carboxyl-terminal processing protease
MVVSARAGSPAEKAGMRPGDVLKTIDAKHTRPLAAQVGQRLLRGAPGSVVKLTVLRAGESDPLEISLVREKAVPVPPKGRILDGTTTGYLKLAEIRPQSADDVRTELEALRKSGAKDLVLDLRGVAEGSIPEAARVAELFLKGGVVAKIKGAHVTDEVLKADPARSMCDLPMATLIDHGTAGPGEIVAGALLDAGRSPLVGKRTFGRAASQKAVPLEEGGLVVTFAKYFTPKDNAIHGKGVEPTVAVKTTDDDDDAEEGATPTDTILEKALEVLRSGGEVKKAA